MLKIQIREAGRKAIDQAAKSIRNTLEKGSFSTKKGKPIGFICRVPCFLPPRIIREGKTCLRDLIGTVKIE
jgi:hypothetical protein